MIGLLVTLLLSPVVVDDAAADARLQAIERGYATTPGLQWERDAERLAIEAPTSAAAGRALLWLGSLAQHDGRDGIATQRYDEVKRRFPTSELAALADRGLGDIALRARRWSDAIARFEAARPDATPVLRYELEEKIQIAHRERSRWHWEIAAWLGFGLCLIGLACPLRSGRPFAFDVKFLAPIYVVLIAAAWGRDPHVPIAMAWIATGSVLLNGVRREHEHRRLRDAAMTVMGSACMIYIGLCRANVLGPLIETLRMGRSAPL
jgi:hypothetical protein